MKFSLKDILRLREALALEAELSLPLTAAKCGILSELVEGSVPGKPEITKRYLYDYLHLNLNKAKSKGLHTYGLNLVYVEKLVRYLGFEGIDDWLNQSDHLNRGEDNQRQSMNGIYYSFVRCNSGRPDLLRSPLRIWSTGKTSFMELKGKMRNFQGKISFGMGNMFVLLKSAGNKQIHLVCKVGSILRPEMIQCVFTGISSGGDPIAGKELLMRLSEANYELCTNARLSIDELEKSDDFIKRRIAGYFADRKSNIMKIEGASTFTARDLEMGHS